MTNKTIKPSASGRALACASVFALGVTLTGCLATTGGQPATQYGAFGVPQGEITTVGIDYLKGEQKVVIGSFRVAFSQKVSASARSSSLFGTDSQSAGMSGTLTGLDNAQYQAIADTAYADFVKKLKTTGLQVIEPQALQQSELYKQMASSPSPLLMGDQVMVAPTGMKLAIFPGEAGVSSAFGGFDTTNPMRVFPQLAKEQSAGVMSVTYYVDFLNASTSGNTRILGGDAEVSMGQGLSVRAGSGIDYSTLKGVQCVGYCPNAVSSIDLGQAVYSTEPYGVSRDVTAGGVNTLGIMSGLLTGSGFSRKDIEITADPARYQKISEQLLESTNTKLVDAVQKAR